MSHWETAELNNYHDGLRIKDIRPLPGVYCIYLDNVLSYVGSSKNIRSRVHSYKIEYAEAIPRSLVSCYWGLFFTVKVKVFYSQKKGDWLMREYRLIDKIKPKYNKLNC